MPENNLHEFFTKNEQPFIPQNEPEATQELPEDLKNRHIRRLEEKLQRERESNIQMSARVEALAEAQKMRQQPESVSWEEKARRIYGNEKPENAAASDLLVESIREAAESARTQALEEARKEFRERQEEERRETETVQSYIENIEDKFGVDFTSSAQGRERQQEFREFWFRLSPKDDKGGVIAYADPYETFELFNARQSNPAKDFASRSMTRSRPVETPVQDDATTSFLKENGIIDPF